MISYFERYKQGDYEQVWTELLALGSQVRHQPLYSEAQAVASMTMERVLHNLEVLIPRLQTLGYVFGFVPHPDEEVVEVEYPPVYVPPALNTGDRISRLENVVGFLPLSLRAFYEVIGGVNLLGKHPKWESYGLDPLLVLPLNDELVEECTAEYDEENACWYLAIAPDHYFKDGVGGDGNYEIALPNAAVDAPLLLEWHETTFVNYLRISLRWGGLPGLERSINPPLQDIAYLTEGLLPI